MAEGEPPKPTFGESLREQFAARRKTPPLSATQRAQREMRDMERERAERERREREGEGQ